ncbi:MAG: 23S rRNA (uracil(1939)-C(5))-methyltransferase RlmD [Proteobacteria bacterium]|nr:23S rRNA (uracil(1939)-C(5))-methyltransferase RlmD [Pseudomonadota bacterium]
MGVELTIESLDQDGRGVAHHDGKVAFVDGALPGERVDVEWLRRKPSYDVARAVAIRTPNAARVTPRCPHFGTCGGCSLQHAGVALQVAAKQRALEDALARLGRVSAAMMLPPVYGPAWEYRWRARLSVRHVVKKGGVLVGFHERKSSYVADMRECHVVPRKLSDLLVPLRELVAGLVIRDRMPQIEVAFGEPLPGSDRTGTVCILVFRNLEPLSEADTLQMIAFAREHDVDVWLQPGGPATAAPLSPASSGLCYTLPEFGVTMPFSPTEFTQVNPFINRVLVRRAVALLAPAPRERVADFFCGLGNFTLPIARSGAHVVGVEGSGALVERARANAAANGLAEATSFAVANLFTVTPGSLAPWLPLDRVLIDPPRDGAVELVKALPAADAASALKRIVYVSCNPATLARDAGILVHERGYALAAAGVVNMFPHTAHVESIAVFERESGTAGAADAGTPDEQGAAAA